MKSGFSLKLACFLLGLSSIGVIDAFASPRCGKDAVDLIPRDWSVLAEVRGDLNRDQVEDVAIVAAESVQAGGKRRLIVARSSSSLNQYCVYFINDGFVPIASSPFMEEPFSSDGLRIDRGSLVISFDVFFSAGSWSSRSISYRFRFANGVARLIGYDSRTMSRDSGGESAVSINFLTGELQETADRSRPYGSKKKCPELSRRLVLMENIDDSLDFDVAGLRCR